MIIKTVVFVLGVCLAVGFLWFAAQVAFLGLREFFKNKKTKKMRNA